MMAIIGKMDLGIGPMVSSAYVRIDKVEVGEARSYHDDDSFDVVTEYQVSIRNYFSKEGRDLEILKELVATIDQTELSDEQKQFLNINYTARGIQPLQTMIWSTINVEGFPLPGDPDMFPFFYALLKKYNICGDIENPADDLSSANMVIETFKAEHPEFVYGVI